MRHSLRRNEAAQTQNVDLADPVTGSNGAVQAEYNRGSSQALPCVYHGGIGPISPPYPVPKLLRTNSGETEGMPGLRSGSAGQSRQKHCFFGFIAAYQPRTSGGFNGGPARRRPLPTPDPVDGDSGRALYGE
jgi:hypothetical protein